MMLNFDSIFDSNWVAVVGWTLIHFVWQAGLVAILVALFLLLTRRLSANVRYWIACCGLLAMATAPLVTLCVLSSQRVAGPVDSTWAALGEPLSFSRFEGSAAPAMEGSGSAGPIHAADGGEPGIAIGLSGYQDWGTRVAPYLVTIWSLGVLVLILRTCFGLLRVFQWKSHSKPVQESLQVPFRRLLNRMGCRGVELLECTSISIPGVVGFLKPVVLVPAAMLSSMPPAQLEAILAHELAHVKRHDFLVNLIQTVIEIVLFYHPAVWWVSKQIRVQREFCCDDLAISVVKDRQAYATALVGLESLRIEKWVLAANGGSLLTRIERIVSFDNTKAATPVHSMVGVATAFLIVLGIGMGSALATRSLETPHSNRVEDSTQHALGESDKDEEQAKVIREVTRKDSKSGLDKKVFPGILLKAKNNKNVRLDMMYSNVLEHSLIPQRVAKQLGAEPVGDIRFFEIREPIAFSIQMQISRALR